MSEMFTCPSTGARIGVTEKSAPFVEIWKNVTRSYDEKKATCEKELIELWGVKAIHPNDGWIDRKNEKIIALCYPSYKAKQRLKIGDRVALGWHTDYYLIVEIEADGEKSNFGFDDEQRDMKYKKIALVKFFDGAEE